MTFKRQYYELSNRMVIRERKLLIAKLISIQIARGHCNTVNKLLHVKKHCLPHTIVKAAENTIITRMSWNF